MQPPMADTATAAAPNAAGEPAAAAPPAAAPTPAAAATPASAAAAAASSTSSGAAASLASKPLADNNKASEGVVAGFDQEWAELQKLQDLHEHAEFGSLLQPGEPPAADSAAAAAAAAATDTDKRSVYVGNVDYSATPADLQEHFKGCGQINRITIMVDRFTGHPKGYAYIEFNSELAAQHAVLLSESTLKDRQIKVVSKRKNLPGMSRGRGGAPWRGGRGSLPLRGRARGAGGFRPVYRSRGGLTRGYGRPY